MSLVHLAVPERQEGLKVMETYLKDLKVEEVPNGKIEDNLSNKINNESNLTHRIK